MKVKPIVAAVTAATSLLFAQGAVGSVPYISGVADAMLNVQDFMIRTSSGGIIGIDAFANGAKVISATTSTTHTATSNINGISGLNYKSVVGALVDTTPFEDANGLVRDCSADNYSIIGGTGPANPCVNDTSEFVGIGTKITYFSEIGNIGLWDKSTPYTEQAQPGLTQFARSQSDSDGNAIADKDDVTVHSTTALLGGPKTGNSSSSQKLTASFEIELNQTVTLDLTFDAVGFLRAALGQEPALPGNSASANYAWTASLNGRALDANGNPTDSYSVSWSPDGDSSVADGQTSITCKKNNVVNAFCTETADGFDLNDNIGAGFTEDNTIGSVSGTFGAVVTLPRGKYTFVIDHSTGTSVTTPLPLPGTLALLGIGLFGVGLGVRRHAMQSS